MRNWMSVSFATFLLIVGPASGQDAGIVGVWEQTVVHSPNGDGIIEERLEIMQFRGDGVLIANIHVSGRLVLIAVGRYSVVGNTVTIFPLTALELIDETEETVELHPEEIQTVGGDRFRVAEKLPEDSAEFFISGDELTLSAGIVLTRSVRTPIAPSGLVGTAVPELTWGMVKGLMVP